MTGDKLRIKMAVNKIDTKKYQSNSESAGLIGKSGFNWIVITLVIAAVLELLLYRTFSRVGVFIPKEGERMATFRTVYNISVQVGTIVLNFSVVLAIVTLVVSALRFRRTGEFGATAQASAGRYGKARNIALTVAFFAISIAVGLSLALLILVQSEIASFSLRTALLVAFSALALDMWLRHADWRWRLFTVLMWCGYAFQLGGKIYLDSISSRIGGSSADLFLPLINLGETLVVVNGIVAFICFVRVDWSVSKLEAKGGGEIVRSYSLLREIGRHPVALLGALVLTAIFVFLTLITVAETYIVPILALYGLGYAMHLPLALYVISLLFIFYTIFYLLGRWKTHKALALGLLLLLVGGYTFNITQQYLFALVGVLLIARPEVLD
jgi:hypothetical protein